MKKYCLPILAVLCLLSTAHAQKKVLGYPFQFEKSFLAKGQYSTEFLDNPEDSAFALILKDNKKVEYAWLSKSFKVIGKVPTPIGNTILDQNAEHYVGGTARGSEYHFIYQAKSEFSMETVDFNSKTVSHKKMFELPSSEKFLCSISDHNAYYCVTADDKAGNIVLHTIDATGTLSQKDITYPIPSWGSHKLSEYLAGIKGIKSEEDPELSTSIHSAKLFSRPGDLRFIVNKGDHPTQVFSINIADFSTNDRSIDEGSLVSSEDKGKVYVSSYVRDTILYSLILNKKSIRIAIQDLASGRMLNHIEITDDAGLNLLAETPITERRMGNHVDAKDVDDLKKVIRAFTKGTEGIMVSQMPNGRLVLTAGTYDPIKMQTGGSGPQYMGGFQPSGSPAVYNAPITSSGAVYMAYNPYMYMLPGRPAFTTTSARYYTTTYFRLLLDPVTFRPVKGQVRRPVADQIKDYVDDTDKKSKATNQFAIGKNQYYGFYDRDAQEYVIEQIHIF